MTDSPTPTTAPLAPEQPVPIALRPAAERHAHVVARLMERGALTWIPESVAMVEAKIKMVRERLAEGKPVAPILPRKLSEDKMGKVQYWRVLIGGKPHTFVWSTIADGLISYRGPGELAKAHVRPKEGAS